MNTALLSELNKCNALPSLAEPTKVFNPMSSNGRTMAFGAVNRGSMPCVGTNKLLSIVNSSSAQTCLVQPCQQNQRFMRPIFKLSCTAKTSIADNCIAAPTKQKQRPTASFKSFTASLSIPTYCPAH